MKAMIGLFFLISATGAFAADDDRATEPVKKAPGDHVSLKRPNAISVELLGRGLLYSLNYDRSISESMGVGAGFSYYSLSASSVSATVLILPLYMNYYFSPDNNRFFLTGGLDIAYVRASAALGSSTVSASASGVGLVAGGGYEFRGDGGFLFRLAPYMIAGVGGVRIWAGLSFGAAF